MNICFSLACSLCLMQVYCPFEIQYTGPNMLYTEMNPRRAQTEFLFHTTDEVRIRIQTRMENETVWLSINQMAELSILISPVSADT